MSLTKRNHKQEPQPAAVVIGASAGGFDALRQVLAALPAGFSLPLVTVLHVAPDMSEHWEQTITAGPSGLPIKEAGDKEPLLPGQVYMAPPGYHLLIERDKILSLSVDAKVNLARPSIDVLFESAAEAYGDGLVGVILSGASHDGARGLKAIANAGGKTVVQDPETAKFPTMPAAALQATAGAIVLSLDAIGRFLAALAPSLIKADPA